MKIDLTDKTLSGQLKNVSALSAMRTSGEAWAAVERHQLFGHLSNEQLAAIACGDIDAKQLAHDELVARGVAS